MQAHTELSPLTILHTEWSDGWGGQERRIISEMSGMKTRGHRMILVCRDEAKILEHAEYAGLEGFTLPFAGKFDLRTIVPLVEIIRSEKIDLVNTHSGKDSWSAGLAAYYSGTPLIRTRHSDLPLKRSWHNFVHKLPEAMITCGAAVREQMIANGFPADQLVNIPTGIDFERFQPRRTRSEVCASLGVDEDTPLIVMTAVFRSAKRHTVALQAFAQVLRAQPEARMILVGDGPLLRDTERFAQTLGVMDAVRFLGYRDDVADFMAAADCVVLPSRGEGVPQSLTQAMGLARAVVATPVGGIPELIEHERTGLLVDVDDIDSLAIQVLRVLNDAELAQRLGAAAQQHVQQHFSFQRMIDAVEALSYQVVNRYRQRSPEDRARLSV